MNRTIKALSAMLISLLLLTACSAELTDQEYIAKARAYENQKQFNAAIIELKNALLNNPENGEVRILLGRMHLLTSNPSSAEKEFKRAGELGIPASQYVASLSKAYLEQGNITDILDLEISEGISTQDRADLLASRGYAFVSLNRVGDAAEEFKQALDLNPKSAYALVGKAGYFALQQLYDEAFAELDKAIAIDPDYSQAWSYKGSLEKHQGKFEQAIQSYNKAIEVNPSNDRARIKRALLLVQTDELAKAETELAYLKKKYSDAPDVNYVRGLLFFKQKRFSDAQIALEHVVGLTDDHLQARFLLGQVHLLRGNLDEALSIVSPLVAENPGWPAGKKLLARIYLQQRDTAKVRALLEQVIATSPDDLLSLNLLADALLLEGKDDEALEKLSRVLELQPDSARYRMRLGAGLLQTGDDEKGLELLDQALQIDSTLDTAELVKIKALLRKGKLDEALEAARQYAEHKPDSAIAHNLLGVVYAGRNDLERAAASFEAAKQISKSNRFANQNLASMALLKQQPEKAKGYLQDILDQHPSDLGSMLKLATIEGLLNHPESKRKLLVEAARKHPDSIAPRLEMARDFLKENNFDAAKRELGSIDSRYRDNPLFLELAGKMYLTTSEPLKAEHNFQRLIKQRPRSAEAHYLLARAYAMLDQKRDYRATLEKVLELEPDHDAANRALLRLLIMENGDQSEVSQRFERLRARGVLDDSYLALEALHMEKIGNTEAALAKYNKWVEKDGGERALIELSRFQWRIGEPDKAVETLENWSSTHPGQLGIMLELGNTYLGTGAVDKAVEVYKNVLGIAPNNLIAINNLAWHLKDTAPSKALEYAERAYKSSPNSPTVIDTLSMVLLSQGEHQRALELIGKALELAPANPSFLYHKAEILAQSNQLFDARSVLLNIRDMDRPFPEKKQAAELLERLGAE